MGNLVTNVTHRITISSSIMHQPIYHDYYFFGLLLPSFFIVKFKSALDIHTI